MSLRAHVNGASKFQVDPVRIIMDSEIITRESDQLLDKEFEKDYVVNSIGAFGPWQAKVCIISALVRLVSIWNMLSIIFLTPVTVFTCVKFENNTTFEVKNSTCYDNCIEYKFYKDVIFEENLISEFHLICNDAWKASFSQTMIMCGFLVGVSLFGWISDKYGRRIGLIISSFINILLMLLVPFSPTYWIFNGLRFFNGMASGGCMIISVVIIIEVVGPQYKEAAGSLAVIPDGFAQTLLSLFAYFAIDWRMYLLEYGAISVFIYILIIYIPETPRWLMSKGKVEQTLNVMSKAAKWNKLDISVSDIQHNILKAYDDMMVNDKDVHKSTYIELFRTSRFAFKIIGLLVIWFSAGTCFFGINQYITFIGSNLYITVIILGCIQIPTTLLAIILNKSFGRKISLVATFSVIGTAMTILIFMPPGHKMCTILGVVGFAATCTTFGVLYVYVAELFPTQLRTMAYGLSSAGAKFGAMVAPFIATITPHWIPSLVFAVIPFVASVFCLLLPETRDKNLYQI